MRATRSSFGKHVAISKFSLCTIPESNQDRSDLETLQDIDRITNTFYGVAWSYDASYIFYNTQSELAQGLQVWRHQLGTSPTADVLVHNEEDASFEVHVASTNDGDCTERKLFFFLRRLRIPKNRCLDRPVWLGHNRSAVHR